MHTAQDLAAYQRAFRAIDADPAHLLVVAQAGRQLVATMQLSFIPGLARRRGCVLVQLTTDKSRLDAHRFYRQLGFVASHEGMKLRL